MANMSYCRFENTYNDLRDCYKAMRNGVDDLSDTEKEYYNEMVKLCANIASQFEEVELEEN